MKNSLQVVGKRNRGVKEIRGDDLLQEKAERKARMARSLDFKSCKLEEFSLTMIELDGQIESERSLAPVAKIATAAKAKHVVILMQNVKYMNSNALGGLLALHQKVEKRGFHMYTVNPVGGIKTVMERLGYYELMRIRESLEDVILEIKAISE